MPSEATKAKQHEYYLRDKEYRADKSMIDRYDKELEPMLYQILLWAKDGNTIEEISTNLGMTRQTLAKYRAQFPELDKAIAAGRESSIYDVENALKRAATGYMYSEYKTTYKKGEGKDSEGKDKYIKTGYEEYKKMKHPDVAAITLYLTNRNPEAWTKKVDINSFNKTVQTSLLVGAKAVSPEMVKNVLHDLDNGNLDSQDLNNYNSLLDVDNFEDAEEIEENTEDSENKYLEENINNSENNDNNKEIDDSLKGQ